MFAVAWTSLFDNITHIEFVDADCEKTAILAVENLQDYFEEYDDAEIEDMTVEQMLEHMFNGDTLVGVEEVPN